MTLTDMDYVRSALSNALFEGLTVYDCIKAAEHAETAQQFENAVNELTETVPPGGGFVIDETVVTWITKGIER